MIKFEIDDLTRPLRRKIRKTFVNMGCHSRPSFLIIGAQKAGTTALSYILRQHLQIVPSRKKELNFFDSGKIEYGDFSSYHEMFPLPLKLFPNKITYESSPIYLFHSECASRIHKYSPKMRLIIILREPVSRAFSAWNMYSNFQNSSNPRHQKLAEPRTFEEAIMQEIDRLDEVSNESNRKAYIRRGFYLDQIESYLQYFPREALLILEQSELRDETASTLNRICNFLRLDSNYRFDLIQKNVSSYATSIPEQVGKRLKSIYVPHNERLFEFLGIRYNW